MAIQLYTITETFTDFIPQELNNGKVWELLPQLVRNATNSYKYT